MIKIHEDDYVDRLDDEEEDEEEANKTYLQRCRGEKNESYN